jgi:hypothetical protein
MNIHSQIDDAIFTYLGTANGNWRKVAMVIGRAANSITENPIDEAYEMVARRIEALVAGQKLLSRGDITNWRYSEIRIPDETSL